MELSEDFEKLTEHCSMYVMKEKAYGGDISF